MIQGACASRASVPCCMENLCFVKNSCPRSQRPRLTLKEVHGRRVQRGDMHTRAPVSFASLT